MTNMSIRNNIPALNIHGNLRLASRNEGKAMERLSSGYRINRASDGAAELAISEKMRGQIRGLRMAERNVEDAIALIRTAEGGLAVQNNMLQRMRELALASSNDIFGDLDRSKLADEYDALMDEIDRIAGNAEYNNLKLLNGSSVESGSSSGSRVASRSASASGAAATLALLPDEARSLTVTPTPGNNAGVNGTMGSVNWSNVGGRDLTWLRDKMADVIIPSAVNALLDALPDAFAFLRGSNFGIGISHTNLPGTSEGMATYEYNYSYPSGGQYDPSTYYNERLTLSIQFDTAYLLEASNNSGGFASPDEESSFYQLVTHEMTHAVMQIATLAGMHGFSGMGEFPSWYKEGMAQAAGGHNGWVDHLTPASSDADIRAILSKLTSGSGNYDAGYLATMYYGWIAGGKGAVSSETIATGLDRVLDDVVAGKSLNQSFLDRVGMNVSAFEAAVKAGGKEICDFVRELVADLGANGSGSLLFGLGEDIPAWSGGTSESFLTVNRDYDTVTNRYPGDYNLISGGGLNSSGIPLTPEAGIGGPIIPPGPPDPPPVDPPPVIPPIISDRPTAAGYAANNEKSFVFQVGPNGGQIVSLYIPDMDSESMGISDTSIATLESAMAALEELDLAMEFVVGVRGKLGAMLNRLEFTFATLGVTEENLANAESRIRDADMAKEMMELAKSQTLRQVGIAMLAQANQAPEMVLQLLG